MKCPQCGDYKTSVTRTTKLPDGETIRRERRCKTCKSKFESFESFDRADPEMAFAMAEARDQIEKALGWMRDTSHHIPVVRDACKLLRCAVETLQDPDVFSSTGAETGK